MKTKEDLGITAVENMLVFLNLKYFQSSGFSQLPLKFSTGYIILIGAKHELQGGKEEEKAYSDTQLLARAARKINEWYCPQVEELGFGQESTAVMNGSK